MKNPSIEKNRKFLYNEIKKYRMLDKKDELLVFLEFDEFLKRGIFLDKRVCTENIESEYAKYMKLFAQKRNIEFNVDKDNTYHVILDNNVYDYKIESNRIKKKRGKIEDEKEID